MADYTAVLGGAALGAVASFFVDKKSRRDPYEKAAIYAAVGAGIMFAGKAVMGSKSGGHVAGFVGAAADCGPASYWDATTQQCVPIALPVPPTGPTALCPPGMFQDYFTQKCIWKSCPPGMFRDPFTQTCVSKSPTHVGVQSGPAIVGWEQHRGLGHESHPGFGHPGYGHHDEGHHGWDEHHDRHRTGWNLFGDVLGWTDPFSGEHAPGHGGGGGREGFRHEQHEHHEREHERRRYR